MRTSDGSDSKLGGRRLRTPLTPLAGASVAALALLAATPACDSSSGAVYDEATGVPMLDAGAGGPVTITIGLTQGELSFGGSGAMGGASAVGGIGTVGNGGTTSTTTGTGGGTAGPTREVLLASAFCGDGVRDTVKEECDDGPELVINGKADKGDFCSEFCQVTDARLVVDGVADTPKATIARRLGAGRHPTAASVNGFAVAVVQQGPVKDAPSVRVARFDALGHRTGVVEASTGTLVQAADADPVVAMTPSDDVIVAFTDFGGDGDGKGIAARVIRAAKTTPEKTVYAAQQRFGAQYAPDILALSDHVIIAWTDESAVQSAPDIRYREFSFDLAPLSDEKTLVAAANVQGRVALAALGTSWGATWRSSNGEGLETTEVYDANSGARFSVPAHLPAHAEEIPALLPLDDTRRLLVFTAGVNTDEAGDAGVGDVYSDELFVAALDVQTSGTATVTPLAVTSAYQSHVSLSRRRPALVRTQTDAYLAWWSGAPLANTQGEDVWLERLTASVSGGHLNVTLNGEVRLPRWPTEISADQRFPALTVGGAVPANAGGSLFAAWDDYLGALSGASHPDVVAQLAPLPLVRQSSLVTDCTADAKCGAGKGPCKLINNNSDCQQQPIPLVCATIGPQFGYGVGIGVCVPAHCANLSKDQDETGVNCGGSCGTCMCGDGVFSPMLGEVCDDGKQTAYCDTNCQLPVCGDNITNTLVGEQCDDGNRVNTDTCTNICHNAVCGDEIIETGVETCDLGALNNNQGECTLTCHLPICGDGFIQAGEVCDDGTANGTVASNCGSDCKPNLCGNGVRGLSEECDLGAQNSDTGLACTTHCKLPVCGDGLVQINESCDDGNKVNNDACPNSCSTTCGDGIMQGTEPCDDGNQSNTDACTYGCKSPFCGDKFVRAGVEDCDVAVDSTCNTNCTATKGCLTGGSCLSAWAQSIDAVGDNAIQISLYVKNNGSTSVAMNTLKLRYWLSREGTSSLVSYCDSATMGCTNIVRSLKSVSPVRRGADNMLEVTFTGTKTLAPGTNSGETRLRITKQDGTAFNEADDFSYPGTAASVADTNLAIYKSNTLVWGNEPHSVPFCGDGIPDTMTGETCDTTHESSSCNENCTTARCGDAILNVKRGEVCDTGGNALLCDSDCTVPACNDGVWNSLAGEVCEPSVVTGCKTDCKGWLTPGTACTQSSLCLHVDQKISSGLQANTIKQTAHIVNSGNAPVSMRDVTLRFWFTSETGSSTYATNCDSAYLSGTTNQCSLVTQSISAVSPARTQADHMWQVTFNSDIQLAPGASTGDIILRANKSDWSSFNETNDWSHALSSTLTPTTHVALYIKGVQMWGQEPQ